MKYALDNNIKFDYLGDLLLQEIKVIFTLAVANTILIGDISGTSYPIKSNAVIAEALAKRRNAAYISIQPLPTRPALPEMWNHYVECDDAVHRIGRLPLPRGIDLYQGSQVITTNIGLLIVSSSPFHHKI